MNLSDLMRAELQLWVLIGIPTAIICAVALWAWSVVATNQKKTPKPKGPHISLTSPCPACGNIGCMLNYDPAAQVVLRKCVHCGCVLRQAPVAPSLFAAKK